MEKKEPLCSVDGNVNWCSHYGKQYGCSSKMKNRTALWSSNPISEYISKGNKSRYQKFIHTIVFIAMLFAISKIWKQPKCPSMDECIKKIIVYIYMCVYVCVPSFSIFFLTLISCFLDNTHSKRCEVIFHGFYTHTHTHTHGHKKESNP